MHDRCKDNFMIVGSTLTDSENVMLNGISICMEFRMQSIIYIADVVTCIFST